MCECVTYVEWLKIASEFCKGQNSLAYQLLRMYVRTYLNCILATVKRVKFKTAGHLFIDPGIIKYVSRRYTPLPRDN